MSRKTNEVLLSTDDKDLSASELKRKSALIKKQEVKEEVSKEEKTSKKEVEDKETKEKVSEEKESETNKDVVGELQDKEEEATEEATEEAKDLEVVEEEIVEEEVEKEDSTIEKVKSLRVKIDRVYGLSNKEFIPESEIVAAIFLGKAWLGKLLSFLNSKNPYEKEGGVKSRKDIPSTADVYQSNDFHSELYQFNLKNKLDKVLILRKDLGVLIDLVESLEIVEDEVSDIRLAKICKTNAYTQLSQAKFLLGDELSKLKL